MPSSQQLVQPQQQSWTQKPNIMIVNDNGQTMEAMELGAMTTVRMNMNAMMSATSGNSFHEEPQPTFAVPSSIAPAAQLTGHELVDQLEQAFFQSPSGNGETNVSVMGMDGIMNTSVSLTSFPTNSTFMIPVGSQGTSTQQQDQQDEQLQQLQQPSTLHVMNQPIGFKSPGAPSRSRAVSFSIPSKPVISGTGTVPPVINEVSEQTTSSVNAGLTGSRSRSISFSITSQQTVGSGPAPAGPVVAIASELNRSRSVSFGTANTKAISPIPNATASISPQQQPSALSIPLITSPVGMAQSPTTMSMTIPTFMSLDSNQVSMQVSESKTIQFNNQLSNQQNQQLLPRAPTRSPSDSTSPSPPSPLSYPQQPTTQTSSPTSTPSTSPSPKPALVNPQVQNVQMQHRQTRRRANTIPGSQARHAMQLKKEKDHPYESSGGITSTSPLSPKGVLVQSPSPLRAQTSFGSGGGQNGGVFSPGILPSMSKTIFAGDTFKSVPPAPLSPSVNVSSLSVTTTKVAIPSMSNPKSGEVPKSMEEKYKELDAELLKIDFEDVTVTALKEMLRVRGLPSTGKKVLLVERIQEQIRINKLREEGKLPPEEDLRHPNYQRIQLQKSSNGGGSGGGGQGSEFTLGLNGQQHQSFYGTPGSSSPRSSAHSNSPTMASSGMFQFGSIGVPISPVILGSSVYGGNSGGNISDDFSVASSASPTPSESGIASASASSHDNMNNNNNYFFQQHQQQQEHTNSGLYVNINLNNNNSISSIPSPADIPSSSGGSRSSSSSSSSNTSNPIPIPSSPHSHKPSSSLSISPSSPRRTAHSNSHPHPHPHRDRERVGVARQRSFSDSRLQRPTALSRMLLEEAAANAAAKAAAASVAASSSVVGHGHGQGQGTNHDQGQDSMQGQMQTGSIPMNMEMNIQQIQQMQLQHQQQQQQQQQFQLTNVHNSGMMQGAVPVLLTMPMQVQIIPSSGSNVNELLSPVQLQQMQMEMHQLQQMQQLQLQQQFQQQQAQQQAQVQQGWEGSFGSNSNSQDFGAGRSGAGTPVQERTMNFDGE
ncbi:hypothetical protein HDU76_005266 [Blyttiomyces sp. JEL0837]|nr:hypothetical protein HDU76_005266 [Blyttiomyces sp. JEL0837]